MSGRFEIKADESGKFYFNLKAENGQIILTSQGYESKQGAEKGIESVCKIATDDDCYERKTASNGEAYFVLKAGNNEVIGRSELYSSTSAMEDGIASVKTSVTDAEIVDVSEI